MFEGSVLSQAPVMVCEVVSRMVVDRYIASGRYDGGDMWDNVYVQQPSNMESQNQ
jgi:hypothetical protein